MKISLINLDFGIGTLKVMNGSKFKEVELH